MTPTPFTIAEWATSNCTAMNAPDDNPEIDVSARSTLSAGSSRPEQEIENARASSANRP